MRSPLRPWLAAALAFSALSCGPGMRRDLTQVPQRQITYDDLCHLQDHFDQRRVTNAAPFRALQELSNETSETEPDEFGRMRRVMVGQGTYVVRDRTDRQRLAQLLQEEMTRLPPVQMTGPETTVSLSLGWWQSGTIRRIRPDQEAVLTVDGNRITLPPHPCLGEFLFGDAPYAIRHNVFSSDRERARGLPPQDPSADAGSGGDAGEVVPDGATVR